MLQIAAERFQTYEKKPFLFMECMPILQQMPKFDPMSAMEEIVTDSDDNNAAVQDGEKKLPAINVIGEPMGSNIPRPRDPRHQSGSKERSNRSPTWKHRVQSH
jgi:hypothetical protein